MLKLKTLSPLQTILNSYSQIFFSENKPFAVILIIISFFDFWSGACGLFSVIAGNGTAYILGYNKLAIKKGAYGFNLLMVGLGIGIYFQAGIELFVIAFFGAMLTLFITIALEGMLAKYGLPYLSIPFLLGIWSVMLASQGFSELGLSERDIFTYNNLIAYKSGDFTYF